MRRTGGWTELDSIQFSRSGWGDCASLTASRRDGGGTKVKDACVAYGCFIKPDELLVSLRTAVGNSCSPQVCAAVRLMSGVLSPTAEGLWQLSVCDDNDDASQTCERQKGAQSGATSMASSVNIAVIRLFFMSMLNATLSDVQSQLDRAERLCTFEITDASDPSQPRLCRGESCKYR
jgi:hypothetical protein